MTTLEQALQILAEWWDSLPKYKQNNGLPAQGTIAGALVVLDHLQVNYSLDINSHLAPGGAQIAGLSRSHTKKILARYGEHRSFLQEGGRTNRGTPTPMKYLLSALQPLKLDNLSLSERKDILSEMQRWLVTQHVSEYFIRERVKFIFDPQQSAWQIIHGLLESARSVGKEGSLAQYLVGAKLALRFPQITIRNDSYSTSDVQSGSHGDFIVSDTVFHVTVAPTPGHYEKCTRNLEDGFSVMLLVPDRVLFGAKQNADSVAPGRITVASIESFVSQNLEELAVFSRDELRLEFQRLLDTYNQRVNAVETDKSLLVEIPPSLRYGNSAA